jgi:hypothetical protein
MAIVEAIHSHRVVIPWHNTIEHVAEWTEGSVWAIEKFGLPGDRYVCSPTREGMEFWFREESDAVFMILRWTKN